eukprot:GILJ01009087.1.p1 GENE.GILJ01009087.1~~GILJ01009087.1.p1  ORF type:complete len:1288 (-),score=160.00 GILJ01009087.1:132-3968(-)
MKDKLLSSSGASTDRSGSFVDRVPVSIAFKDLSISLQQRSLFGKVSNEHKVLHNLYGSVESGELMALMGGSGSGKTTLLNALAGRIHGKSASITGSIRFNNLDPKPFIASVSGYVTQHDYLLPNLTVRETLRFAAMLRLPNDMPRDFKYKKVEDVIMELGLKDCADTMIGSESRRGVSGGEKRRVSIAVQMLTNPSVLFLDEPTSGLDSFTALNIVQTLLKLARKGLTVICSIHQPRSTIFELFDSVILLSRGDIVYSGPQRAMESYFLSLGYTCPALTNLADYFLDISSVDSRDEDAEKRTRATVASLVASFRDSPYYKQSASSPVYTPVSEAYIIAPNRRAASFWSQTIVLTQRCFKDMYRDRFTLVGNLLMNVFVALFRGGAFFQLGDDLDDIKSRLALVYQSVMQTYLVVLFAIYTMTQEFEIFDREREDNMYGPGAYLTARFLSSIPLNIFLPVIFSLEIYFLGGLRLDGGLGGLEHIIFYCLLLIGLYFAANSLALFSVAINRSYAKASLIANSCYSIFTMTAGFIVHSSSIPVWLVWTRYLSFVWYGYRLALINEFRDHYFCEPHDAPQCKPYNGNYILEAQDVSTDVVGPVAALVAFIAGFQVLSYLVCKFKVVRPQLSGGDSGSAGSAKAKVKPTGSTEDDKTTLATPLLSLNMDSQSAPQHMDVTVNSLFLSVLSKESTSALKRSKRTQKTILEDVTCKFHPGQLNVIMGGSGSGKTSLLNVITGRVRADVIRGYVLFNGQPSRKQVSIGYVMQNDYLLPSLTVRETLEYAAKLRLPKDMPMHQKMSRVEQVLSEVGLQECADTRIGDEKRRGISGGEKRRVSIAIQMLVDPSILILDEPTSGLDSFTAYYITVTLKKIAQEKGRTVICTLHQPRSDVFNLFDTLILLTKGHLVYEGAAGNVVSYFSALGYECPVHNNPADWVLDLSSVDLRNARVEEESRSRVQRLVDTFATARAASLAVNAEAGLELVVSSPTVDTQEVKSVNAMAPLSVSLPILFSRAGINLMRQPDLIIGRIMQPLAFGVILALFYTKLGDDQLSIQNRIGLLFSTTSFQFIGMLNNVSVFPTERNVFYRERADRSYSSLAFFLSYTLHEIPTVIFSSLLVTFMLTFLIGLQSDAVQFLVMWYVSFGMIVSGESIGICVCAVLYHVGFAVSIVSIVMSFLAIASGLLAISLPLVFQYLNWVSILKYAMAVITVNEFTDIDFSCTELEVQQGVCIFTNGQSVLDFYHMDPSNFARDLGLFTALLVVYRLIAYLALKFNKHKFIQA